MKLFNLLLILLLFCIVFQNCNDSSDNKIVSKTENLNDTFQILEAILDTFQKTKTTNNINLFSQYKDTLIICYDSLYFTPLRHFKKGKYLFFTREQICDIVTDMERKRVFSPKLLKIPKYHPFKNINNHYTICVELYDMSSSLYPDGEPMMYYGERYKGKEKCLTYTDVTFFIDMIKEENGRIKFLKMDKAYD